MGGFFCYNMSGVVSNLDSADRVPRRSAGLRGLKNGGVKHGIDARKEARNYRAI